jgi:BRCT domain type II-containing protein
MIFLLECLRVQFGDRIDRTLYNIFTSDVPSSEFCGTKTFADDTAIFASGQTPFLVQDEIRLTLMTFVVKGSINTNSINQSKRNF